MKERGIALTREIPVDHYGGLYATQVVFNRTILEPYGQQHGPPQRVGMNPVLDAPVFNPIQPPTLSSIWLEPFHSCRILLLDGLLLRSGGFHRQVRFSPPMDLRMQRYPTEFSISLCGATKARTYGTLSPENH